MPKPIKAFGGFTNEGFIGMLSEAKMVKPLIELFDRFSQSVPSIAQQQKVIHITDIVNTFYFRKE